MTIAVRDLNDLDPTLVQANLDDCATRIAEQNPSIDLSVGVLQNLLVYNHSVLATALQQNINDYQNGRSLLAIQADPALADPSLVDDVLSNFGVTRKDGAAAQGEVAIVKNNDLTTTYAVGAQFTAGGLSFVTTQVYTAKAEAALINGPGDRLISPQTDGNFVFTIPVTAVVEGVAGRIQKDTVVVPEVVPAGFVAAYAAADFTDGTDPETNDELLARLQQGVACKAPASRVSMNAMLREIDAFSNISTTSIVGYGDPEMLRDMHWIFPVHGGGRADWYIRTDEPITRSTMTLTATLIDKSGANGIWQFTLGRDTAPGFYEIASIRLSGDTNFTGGFMVVGDVRSFDLSGTGFFPDIVNAAEAAYTRYQTATIQFQDSISNVVDLPVGSQQDYDFDIVGLPLVDQIQDTLNGRDVRAYGSDILVKAPIPCFLQISFTIYKTAADTDPDVASIKTAVAALANQTPFIGRLYASRIQDAIHAYLTNETSVGGIDMFGRLRYPDGRTEYVRDADVLIIPDEPAEMVSAKTVQFFLNPDDVGVTIVSAIPAAL